MRAVVLAIVAPCVVGMQTIGPSTKRVQLKSSADALLAEAQVLRQEAAQEALALHIERLTSAYGEDVTPAALASVLATDEGTTAMLLAAFGMLVLLLGVALRVLLQLCFFCSLGVGLYRAEGLEITLDLVLKFGPEFRLELGLHGQIGF